MPLKHLTETILLVALAVIVILTGVIVSVLPPLQDALPFAIILFAVTLAYPLAFSRLFRTSRADYTLRMLHFAPMAIVALWVLFEWLALQVPSAAFLGRWFTWGHTAGPVLFVLLLIAGFCIQVLRRRVPRLSALSVFAAAFVVFVFLSQSRGWGPELAAIVGGRSPAASSSSTVAGGNASSASLAFASSVRLASSLSSRPLLASSSSSPSRLPTSGLGAEGIATLCMAAWCGMVHRRARRRMAMLG